MRVVLKANLSELLYNEEDKRPLGYINSFKITDDGERAKFVAIFENKEGVIEYTEYQQNQIKILNRRFSIYREIYT